MAIFCTESGISILLLSLRFYERISICGVCYDDWMMLATGVSNYIGRNDFNFQSKIKKQRLRMTVISRYFLL